MATILYNDRINTYRKMKQLDVQLDSNPTSASVKEMAELRVRNLQSFAELQAFNDSGKFLCKHPLLSGRSEFTKLRDLLFKDPVEFLRQHKNVLGNIKRYRSYLKRDDRVEKRGSDRENLERHISKEKIFRMVLEYNNKNQK